MAAPISFTDPIRHLEFLPSGDLLVVTFSSITVLDPSATKVLRSKQRRMGAVALRGDRLFVAEKARADSLGGMGVRMWALAGLLNVAACDRIFGLDPVVMPLFDATTDSTTDGVVANKSCAAQVPSPFLCVDCDDGPVYYKDGQPFQLGTASGSATYACRAPGISSSNALWIESGGGQYYNDVSSLTPGASRLVASFDLEISRFTQASGVLLIEIKGSPRQVQVSLQVQTSAPSLIIQTHCAPTDCYQFAPVFEAVPAGWIHGTLSLDTTTAMARIDVAPTTSVVLDLPSGSFTGTPFVRFGVIDAAAGSGAPELGLDNLIVTLQ